MTVKGGDNSYAISLSTGISSGTPDSPSGDIIYINAPQVKPTWTLMTEIKHESGRQSFSYRDSRKKWVIQIPNCKIVSDIAGLSVMEEFNQITSYIEDWTENSHSPIYLIIANRGLDGTYTPMEFRDNSLTGTNQQYLKGYPISFKPVLKGIISYVEASITFEECWI